MIGKYKGHGFGEISKYLLSIYYKQQTVRQNGSMKKVRWAFYLQGD